MENKNYIWRPVSEYTGGRVLATNGLDVLIGEINSEGDCESEEDGSTILCGITGFIKIEEMLPELQESENERIRKLLVEAVTQVLQDQYCSNRGVSKENVIAWLEKQAKCEIDYPQNHQDVDRPNGCIVLEDFNGGEGFYKVHLDYLNKKQVEEIEEIIRVWNKELKTSNEKQGEQKDSFEMKTPEESLGIDSETYNKIVDECIYGEQKPAEWSEEDEQLYNDLSDTYFYNDEDYPEETYKRMLKNVLDWMNKRAKFLRPQSTWKPSLSQLNALGVVAKGNPPDDIEEIKSLYNDLHKLTN